MRLWLKTIGLSICVGNAAIAGVQVLPPNLELPSPSTWVFTLSHVADSATLNRKPKFFLYDSYSDPDFTSRKYCSHFDNEPDDPRGFTELTSCSLALGKKRNLFGWAKEWVYNSQGPEWYANIDGTFTGFSISQKVTKDGAHAFDGDLKAFVTFSLDKLNFERAAAIRGRLLEPKIREQVRKEMSEQEPITAMNTEEQERIRKAIEDMEVQKRLLEQLNALSQQIVGPQDKPHKLSGAEYTWMMTLPFPLGPTREEFLKEIRPDHLNAATKAIDQNLANWQSDLRMHLNSLEAVVETETLRIYRFKSWGLWRHEVDPERRDEMTHALIFLLDASSGRVHAFYYDDGKLYKDPKDFRNADDQIVTHPGNTSMSVSFFPRFMNRVDSGFRTFENRARGVVDFGARSARGEMVSRGEMVKWLLFPTKIESSEFWFNDNGISLRNYEARGMSSFGKELETPRLSESSAWAYLNSTVAADSIQKWPYPEKLVPTLEADLWRIAK